MSCLPADFPFHLPGGLSAGGRCPGASAQQAVSLPGANVAPGPGLGGGGYTLTLQPACLHTFLPGHKCPFPAEAANSTHPPSLT